MLGLADQVSAQAAAGGAVQGGVSHAVKAGSNKNMEQSRAPMKHALTNTVVMIAELTIKPDKIEEFLEYTVENLKLSRSYPGNLAFDILIDEARPEKVLFYEVWQTQRSQKEYMAWRTQAGDLTKLLAFLAGEPKFTALRSVAT
jgi:quinol monooxygenase YgiN